MSYVDDLLAEYRRFVSLPWQGSLAPAQRVWMAVYPPDHERRLRLHVPDFEVATKEAGHGWAMIDITSSFEDWMSNHQYRIQYFESPELLEASITGVLRPPCGGGRGRIGKHHDADGVVALLGAGALFGLGHEVKVSALLNEVNDAIAGRLLIFFPGEHEGNSYRLLDARDGWNYLATPIQPLGSRQ